MERNNLLAFSAFVYTNPATGFTAVYHFGKFVFNILPIDFSFLINYNRRDF